MLINLLKRWYKEGEELSRCNNIKKICLKAIKSVPLDEAKFIDLEIYNNLTEITKFNDKHKKFDISSIEYKIEFTTKKKYEV